MSASKKGHDATRAERKAKKRKLEDAIPDLPGDNDEGNGEAVEAEAGSTAKKRKRDIEETVAEEGRKEKKKDKKRRRKEDEEAEAESGAGAGAGVSVQVDSENVVTEEKKSKKKKKTSGESAAADEQAPDAPELEKGEEGPRKSKKERKAERRAKEASEAAAKEKDAAAVETKSSSKPADQSTGDVAAAAPETGDAEGVKKAKKNNRNREKKRKAAAAASSSETGAADGTGEKPQKAARFIVFVGNLPFTAKTESIQKHFAAVKPISVRALTQKDDPTKSKGCAFVEFEGYDHMKTCLKLFHHSMFDDGLSAPRKINVELTAGGGGNTKDRRAKIQGKNEKLNEQRVRRMQEEEKAKLSKSSNEAAIDESAIHPSRRARVPGA